MELDVPRSNSYGEEKVYSLWRSRIPKVFCHMILTMTLTLQMVGFRKEEVLVLSLEVENYNTTKVP